MKRHHISKYACVGYSWHLVLIIQWYETEYFSRFDEILVQWIVRGWFDSSKSTTRVDLLFRLRLWTKYQEKKSSVPLNLVHRSWVSEEPYRYCTVPVPCSGLSKHDCKRITPYPYPTRVTKRTPSFQTSLLPPPHPASRWPTMPPCTPPSLPPWTPPHYEHSLQKLVLCRWVRRATPLLMLSEAPRNAQNTDKA